MVCGLLIMVASFGANMGSRHAGFSNWGIWGLENRLNSCGTQACGIFPDQGSNPCLLLWQVDSLPLSHQGSPQETCFYLNTMLWKTLQLEWLSGKMTFFPIGILGHPARGLVLFWRCISIWGNVEKQINFEINSKPPYVSGQVFWAWVWLEAPQYYSASSLGLAEPGVSWPQNCISDPSRSRCFSLSPPFETDWNSHASFGWDLHIVESLE